MWRRFLKDNFWYIIAFAAAVAIMLMTLYVYFGTRAITVSHAQNSARADTLNGAIVALPDVSSIVPAKTSGTLDYVLTSRTNLTKQIQTDYLPRRPFWLFGLLPSFYTNDAQQARHLTVTNDALSTLKNTTQDLSHLKKLIEYMPMVDLGGAFAEDSGLGERLNRTKRGIDDALTYIKLSGLPHEVEIVTKLTKLNARTLTLTDATKAAWAEELLEVQKLLVSDIETQDIQQSKLSRQLRDVAQTYK